MEVFDREVLDTWKIRVFYTKNSRLIENFYGDFFFSVSVLPCQLWTTVSSGLTGSGQHQDECDYRKHGQQCKDAVASQHHSCLIHREV